MQNMHLQILSYILPLLPSTACGNFPKYGAEHNIFYITGYITITYGTYY